MSLEVVKRVQKISEKCLKNGRFDFEEIAVAVGDLAGVGGIVRKIIDLFKPTPDPAPNPVLEELAKLGTVINELSKSMNSKFLDLKAFLIQVKFNTDIIEPAKKLAMFLEDCMTNPEKKALENFQAAYKKYKPLDLVYSLLIQLEEPTTNPLKMYMEADRLRTIQTFDKWYGVINGVLGQLFYLEAIASGILPQTYMSFDSKMMLARFKTLFENMDEWKEKYMTNSSYWNGLKEYFGEFIDSNKDETNDVKTAEIGKTLETILTNDVFFVFFLSDQLHKDYKFSFNALVKDQLIEYYDKGGCHAVIYISKKLNTTEQVNGENLIKDLVGCVMQINMQGMSVGENIDNVPKIYFEKYLQNTGVIALLPSSQNYSVFNCKQKFENAQWTQLAPVTDFSVQISMKAISFIVSRYDFKLFAGYL